MAKTFNDKPVHRTSTALNAEAWESLFTRQTRAPFFPLPAGGTLIPSYTTVKLIELRAQAYFIHEMALFQSAPDHAALLSTQYLCQATQLTVLLPSDDGIQAHEAAVNHCRHITGRIHLVTVAYPQPVAWTPTLKVV